MSTMVLEVADLARLVHASFRGGGPYPLDDVIDHVVNLSAANARAYNLAYAHHRDVQDDPAIGYTYDEVLAAYKRIKDKKIKVANALRAITLMGYNLNDEIKRESISHSFHLIRSVMLNHLIQAMEQKSIVY